MKDFNEQLNRAERAAASGKGKRGSTVNKPVVAAIVSFCVVVLALLIVMIVVFAKFFNQATDVLLEDSGTKNSFGNTYNGYAGSYEAYNNNTAGTTSKTTPVPADFSYGVVAGTNYESSFSGLKFYGPKDWTLQDHTALGSSSNGTLYDMAGQSGDGQTSVAVLFYPLNRKYSSSTAMLKAMQANTEGTILNDTVSLRKGGNNFTGYVYTAEESGTTTYNEVIGAEVNGYILIIQVKAWTSNQLSAAVAYFR